MKKYLLSTFTVIFALFLITACQPKKTEADTAAIKTGETTTGQAMTDPLDKQFNKVTTVPTLELAIKNHEKLENTFYVTLVIPDGKVKLLMFTTVKDPDTSSLLEGQAITQVETLDDTLPVYESLKSTSMKDLMVDILGEKVIALKKGTSTIWQSKDEVAMR